MRGAGPLLGEGGDSSGGEGEAVQVDHQLLQVFLPLVSVEVYHLPATKLAH